VGLVAALGSVWPKLVLPSQSLDETTRRTSMCSVMKAIGVPSIAVKIDLTHRAALEPALSRVASDLGSISILVNNAGNVSLSGGILHEKPEDWANVIETQLNAVFLLSKLASLERQGRIHEFKGHDERIVAIASEYAKSPERTLVVSPDNRSRVEINQAIHSELQPKGVVASDEHRIDVLVPRQDLTGADRTRAERYNVGDVLRYSRSSQETGIGKGEYARGKSVDASNNRLTVERKDGTERTYDPRRQQGVSVYREEERTFSTGDRVQLTAPSRELKAANRELGTVQRIDQDGRFSLRMDGGRQLQIDPRLHPHLDHGYAVTSHSSQGQTGRPRADPRRYRAEGKRPTQQSHGLCCRFARRLRCAALHQARSSAQP